MEDELSSRTPFEGRWHLIKDDDLWWKIIFDGWQPLIEGCHQCKPSFDRDRRLEFCYAKIYGPKYAMLQNPSTLTLTEDLSLV